MKTLIIRGLDLMEVEHTSDATEIMHFDPEAWVRYRDFSGAEDALRALDVQKEIVRGRRFRVPGREDVVIGVSARVGEILGLQYEAFENLQKSLERLGQEIMAQGQASQKHRAYERFVVRAGFFKQLKWLFTGIPTFRSY